MRSLARSFVRLVGGERQPTPCFRRAFPLLFFPSTWEQDWAVFSKTWEERERAAAKFKEKRRSTEKELALRVCRPFEAEWTERKRVEGEAENEDHLDVAYMIEGWESVCRARDRNGERGGCRFQVGRGSMCTISPTSSYVSPLPLSTLSFSWTPNLLQHLLTRRTQTHAAQEAGTTPTPSPLQPPALRLHSNRISKPCILPLRSPAAGTRFSPQPAFSHFTNQIIRHRLDGADVICVVERRVFMGLDL